MAGKQQHTPTDPLELKSCAEQPLARQEIQSHVQEIPIRTDALLRESVHLNARERATAEELGQLDSQLAGLYRLGHELAGRASDPGVAYLLAHVGRELSRGVVQQLAGGELQPLRTDSDEVQDNEGNRRTIGAVLQLPSNHASVTQWFQLNRTFSRTCHYRGTPPGGEEICTSFLQFSELLYGRVAPYFTTHTELGQLLTVTTPSPRDVNRVRALLTRPQLRRHFFSQLQHPSWLGSLVENGYFDSFPEREVESDGSWRMRLWPEGEYLARIAPQESERVTEILLKIPPILRNPAVWAILVDTAKVLPAAHAKRLVPLIEKALQNAPPILFPRRTIDLVRVLAEQGEEIAFRLTECLLWLRKIPEVEQGAEGDHTFRRSRHTSHKLLERIDVYDLEKFCQNALPALETLNAEKTMRLLARRLDQAVIQLAPANGVGTHRNYGSQWWCEHLDHVQSDDDVRAIFAIALTGVATQAAVRGLKSAQAVWATLENYTGDIFERIRYMILAQAGPFLQMQLDRAIGGDALLDPPFGAREVAALLRAQFTNASPGARLLFRHALERGPSADEIREGIEARRAFRRTPEGAPELETLATAEEIAKLVSAWQQRRLRWFHDHIPAELQPLAERLGITPKVPTAEQQGLDEVGIALSSGSWGGERSPKTPEELTAMETQELLSFLATWNPDGNPFDGPSYRGLQEALTAFATKHPDRAIQLVRQGLQRSLAALYTSALLSGLRAAVEAKHEIPWAEALLTVLLAIRAAAQTSTSELDSTAGANTDQGSSKSSMTVGLDPGANRWLLIRAAADLVSIGCRSNVVPDELSDVVWEIIETIIRSSTTWTDPWENKEFRSFSDVLMASINTVSGDVIGMLIEAALWDYQRCTSGREPQRERESYIPEIESRLKPLLEYVLSRQGRSAQSAHGRLGQFVPQLYLLAPKWTVVSEELLFGQGAADPILHPVWGAYVIRCPLYHSTFNQLRPWYVQAADSAARLGAGDDDTGHREWSLTNGLAQHVLSALICGLATIGDEDALVEKTFSAVPVKDRSHTYWGVYRGWSDTTSPIPQESIRRVVEFWEWRLLELERAADTPERAEEADGLIWFLMTPYIPPEDAIRLGYRTIVLDSGNRHTRRGAWERLGELAQVDAAGTFNLVEVLVKQELAADYLYLPYENVAPPLRAALTCSDIAVQERAKRLVHRIGDHGHLQFGELLSPEKS